MNEEMQTEPGSGGTTEASGSEGLQDVARSLVAPGKGILAADESLGTIEKRFASIGVPSTEDNRRAYRQTLLTAEGASDWIGGVILFDETLRQAADDGTPFPEVLAGRGIVPGIKVDGGTHPLAGSEGEVVTEGLDGLRGRLAEYRELGARFTKWRAVIRIGDGIPTRRCVEANAHALARFATLSQEAGMVPIVEPEVLRDGGHSLQRCAEVTEEVLQEVFHQLHLHGLELEGSLLKPNMVVPGSRSDDEAEPEEVARATLRVLSRTVPAAVPGIVFLSGGLSEITATRYLDAINSVQPAPPRPWELSFSFGRALQASALDRWRGDPDNVAAAQRAFLHRARCNGLARSGLYTSEIEAEALGADGGGGP